MSQRTCRITEWRLARAAIALLGVSLAACAKPRPTVQRPVLAGPFHGATEDGKAVEVTFSQDREAFRGEGTIGGEPIVVAGAVGWRGVGSLARGDGGAELVELTLSADSETVLLEREGQPPVTLERGGAPATSRRGRPVLGELSRGRERATWRRCRWVRGAADGRVGIVDGSRRAYGAHTPRTASGMVTFPDCPRSVSRLSWRSSGDAMTLPRRRAVSMRRGGAR